MNQTPKQVKFQGPLTEKLKKLGYTQTEIDGYFAQYDKAEVRVKKFLASIQSLDAAVDVADFVLGFKRMGMPLSKAVVILAAVIQFDSADTIYLIRRTLQTRQLISVTVKKHCNRLTALDLSSLLIATFSIMRLLDKGEYGAAITELYKTSAGLLVPWAGVLEALGTVATIFMPAERGPVRTFFQVVKASDPIGMSVVGTESLTFFVRCVFDAGRGRPVNEKRLAELVDKLKKGPAGYFVEAGEKADSLHIIWEIAETDWKDMVTWALIKLVLKKPLGF